jgi:signal peptidase I
MDGHSMDSTVHDGDELRVQPPPTTIERGNVVLLHEDSGATERYLVKPVVALAGETIEMRDCVVSIDGEVLDEPYLDPEVVTPGNCGGDYGPTTVTENHVFVMGDNRAGSQDSRSDAVGQIDVEDIVGVVDAVRTPGGDWRPIDG